MPPLHPTSSPLPHPTPSKLLLPPPLPYAPFLPQPPAHSHPLRFTSQSLLPSFPPLSPSLCSSSSSSSSSYSLLLHLLHIPGEYKIIFVGCPYSTQPYQMGCGIERSNCFHPFMNSFFVHNCNCVCYSNVRENLDIYRPKRVSPLPRRKGKSRGIRNYKAMQSTCSKKSLYEV